MLSGSYRKDVIKNFANPQEKHLCWSLSCSPLARNFVKRNSNASVFLWNLKNKFKTPSLQNTSGLLLLKNFAFSSVMLLISYLIRRTFIHSNCIISEINLSIWNIKPWLIYLLIYLFIHLSMYLFIFLIIVMYIF